VHGKNGKTEGEKNQRELIVDMRMDTPVYNR